MAKFIYKVCPQSEWAAALQSGTYQGSGDDQRDGFIHFSTAGQLTATLAKHFTGQDGLVLVSVRADAMGDKLKWEPSRGGDLFPHLYGELVVSHATDVQDLPLVGDKHVLPELETS